jgi:N-acetyltransferase 10
LYNVDYNSNCYVTFAVLGNIELDVYLTKYGVKGLEMYSNNLVNYHLVMDLVPALARLYFLNRMGDTYEQIDALTSEVLYGL